MTRLPGDELSPFLKIALAIGYFVALAAIAFALHSLQFAVLWIMVHPRSALDAVLEVAALTSAFILLNVVAGLWFMAIFSFCGWVGDRVWRRWLQPDSLHRDRAAVVQDAD